jgi:hypothetical protein
MSSGELERAREAQREAETLSAQMRSFMNGESTLKVSQSTVDMWDAAEREQSGRPPALPSSMRSAGAPSTGASGGLAVVALEPLLRPAAPPPAGPGNDAEGYHAMPSDAHGAGSRSHDASLSANVTVRKHSAAAVSVAVPVPAASPPPLEPLELDRAAASPAYPADPQPPGIAEAMETEAARPGKPRRNNSTIFTTSNKSAHLKKEWHKAMELTPVRDERRSSASEIELTVIL